MTDPQAIRDGNKVIAAVVIMMALILFSGIFIEWVYGLLP